MTLNGWIQILFFLGAVAAVAVPLGSFMARAFARSPPGWIRCFYLFERLIYRLTGVDEQHEMRWTGVRHGNAGVQRRLDAGSVRAPAPAGSVAAQSAGARRGRRRIWRLTPPRRSRPTPTGNPTLAKRR